VVAGGWFWVFVPVFRFLQEDFIMSATITSVFDLSPSEKLQLVEDLWDDLAATPEAVPIYDWQKEELARRKANLMQNPASGLAWEEVKRRVRNRYGR
jgi:putative addiction module component (TIGR02574 family)